jgi:putative FmdB family regulatory protein
MPLYEYRCKSCGHQMEVLQKFSDPPPKRREKCSGRKVEKLLSRTSFLLKGGGWYSEGYGRAPAKSKEGSDAPSGAGEAAAGEPGDKKSGDAKDKKEKKAKPAKSGEPRSAAAG